MVVVGGDSGKKKFEMTAKKSVNFPKNFFFPHERIFPQQQQQRQKKILDCFFSGKQKKRLKIPFKSNKSVSQSHYFFFGNGENKENQTKQQKKNQSDFFCFV